MSGLSASAWFTGDDGPESHRPRSDGADLTIVERLGGSETTPAELLPVTPAERAVALMLRAWRDWRPSPDDPKGCRDMLVDFGSGAMSVGFADALDLTPAGRELLARVEAANQPPANVLRASIERLRYVISNPPDGDDGAWKSAMRAALREHEAALAAPPADAPLSPRSRAMLAAGIESAKSEPIVDLGSFAPENVLRAMAVSYANAWINEGEDEDWEGHLYAVREALRECLSSGSPGYMPQRIADDYEARRAGARGMHDPPMGAS